MVYPGNVEVGLEVNNGPSACSDVTADVTSCTLDLPRDIYKISITQTNDFGSTVNSKVLNSECITVTLYTAVIPILSKTSNHSSRPIYLKHMFYHRFTHY